MRTILIVLSLFIAQILTAQYDTLIVNVENYATVTFLSNLKLRKKDKELKTHFNEVYAKFYKDFGKAKIPESSDRCVIIRYKTNSFDTKRKISIEKNNKSAVAYFFERKNMQKVKQYPYTLMIDDDLLANDRIIISVNELSDFNKLNNVNLDSIYKDVRKDVINKVNSYKRPYTVVYQQKNNKLDIKSSVMHTDVANDYISIFPDFRASIINNNFAPEISVNLLFNLASKGEFKYRFGASADFLFIPDNTNFFKTYTYNLANVFYDVYVNEKFSHRFNVGYMFRKTGSHFNGNTWTVGWQYNIKPFGFRISAYFTENEAGEKVVLPGFGISFGF